tara:strand:- start:20925 stop:22013 length:1089 start_codon:yes stop_codon:yes gene_type:complete
MKKIVIKMGTGILSAGEGKIHSMRLKKLAEGILALRESGAQAILVSSGSIGLGMGKLGLLERPSELSLLRACASIGQCLLMNAWSEALSSVNLIPAQVLLTRDDFNQRTRSQKVQETLNSLLQRGIVPIVNENDSVSDEEIKFGDNDILSALLASLGKANMLTILSTAKGLMTHPIAGTLIPFVAEITPAIEQMAQGTTSPTAVGGMVTKIEAAKIATKSGCAVFIGSGEQQANLVEILDGKAEGTFFAPAGLELKARKKWLAFFPKAKGRLILDDGACEAILLNGGSLLASGLHEIEGDFEKAEVVTLSDGEGQTIARGISRFSSDDLQKILGKTNAEVLALFPGKNRPEVVHRDHLAPHL